MRHLQNLVKSSKRPSRWLNLDILASIGPKEWENHIARSCFKLFVKQCHPTVHGLGSPESSIGFIFSLVSLFQDEWRCPGKPEPKWLRIVKGKDYYCLHPDCSSDGINGPMFARRNKYWHHLRDKHWNKEAFVSEF